MTLAGIDWLWQRPGLEARKKQGKGPMGKALRENSTPAPFAAEKLRAAGLRPTRQRMELAAHLFRGHDRHVTAESLHDEVMGAGIKLSLATVYNTLHQF